ncbi:F1F0 ATP synthase subunit e, mitochondrial [Friedmanniomyces endolithicus]|nr:F1F0 ATP synthase subunit e, mitochondrial [Friedmanniomyces endolithicus]
MASSGVNLLRWSALVFGVFYGFSHQNAIHSRDKKALSQHEWDRKAQIIDQAKAEWKKRNDPNSAKDNGGQHTIIPPDKAGTPQKRVMRSGYGGQWADQMARSHLRPREPEVRPRSLPQRRTCAKRLASRSKVIK